VHGLCAFESCFFSKESVFIRDVRRLHHGDWFCFRL
jgi:hypothetical protein